MPAPDSHRLVYLRSAPVTMAQREWLMWQPAPHLRSYDDNLYGGVEVTPLTRDAARRVLCDVVARHENLRTLVRLDEDGVERQFVLPADGPDSLDVIELPEDGSPDSVAEVWRTVFDLATRLPVQFIVFLRGTTVVRFGFVADHVAMDQWAVNILREDLAHAAAARADGRPPVWAVEPLQPVDVALQESALEDIRLQKRAIAYWRRQCVEIRARFESAGVRPAMDRDVPIGFRSCLMRSGRAAAAADATAAATGVRATAVYLAAFGSALAAYQDAPAIGFFGISANRFTEPARRSVCKALMPMPLIVPASADAGTFRQAVRVAAGQLTVGHAFANADPAVTSQLCREILGQYYDSGLSFPRFSVLHEEWAGAQLRGQWPIREVLRAGTAEEELVQLPPPAVGPKYMVSIFQLAGTVVFNVKWRSDTSWDGGVESILRHVVDLLCGATPN